ncbi:hypothetical protein [Shewanella goraebulensis]|uniref:hypothetical protein n=1 Tax=Shewanella goraebulensis TaxID=3050637 RepID=UPI00254BD91E|nr:hypothetical protein [Shewanella goraebulensis]
MKSAQIIGFILSIFSAWYLSLFYDSLLMKSSSSPSLGIGVAVVFALCTISVVLTIPTCVLLRSKKARTEKQFTGWFWSSLFALNSICAIAYLLVGLSFLL